MCLTARGWGFFFENHFLLENEPSPLFPPLPLPQPARAGGGRGVSTRRVPLLPQILPFPLIFHPFPRHRAEEAGSREADVLSGQRRWPEPPRTWVGAVPTSARPHGLQTDASG